MEVKRREMNLLHEIDEIEKCYEGGLKKFISDSRKYLCTIFKLPTEVLCKISLWVCATTILSMEIVCVDWNRALRSNYLVFGLIREYWKLGSFKVNEDEAKQYCRKRLLISAESERRQRLHLNVKNERRQLLNFNNLDEKNAVETVCKFLLVGNRDYVEEKEYDTTNITLMDFTRDCGTFANFYFWSINSFDHVRVRVHIDSRLDDEIILRVRLNGDFIFDFIYWKDSPIIKSDSPTMKNLEKYWKAFKDTFVATLARRGVEDTCDEPDAWTFLRCISLVPPEWNYNSKKFPSAPLDLESFVKEECTSAGYYLTEEDERQSL